MSAFSVNEPLLSADLFIFLWMFSPSFAFSLPMLFFLTELIFGDEDAGFNELLLETLFGAFPMDVALPL